MATFLMFDVFSTSKMSQSLGLNMETNHEVSFDYMVWRDF